MPEAGSHIIDWFVETNVDTFIVGVLYYVTFPIGEHTSLSFKSYKVENVSGDTKVFDTFDVPQGCFKIRPTKLLFASPELSSYALLCSRDDTEIYFDYREKGKFGKVSKYLISTKDNKPNISPLNKYRDYG